MADKRARGVAAKSDRRAKIVATIMRTLKGDQIFHTLDYRRKSEAYVKQYMHQPLRAMLMAMHRELTPDVGKTTLRKKADESLLWEGDVKTTINNIRFLGVQHRPDFVVQLDNKRLRIAVEVKRGETGAAVREGIGQSLVYAASEDFEFVVFLFVDTSKDKKIARSLDKKKTLDQAFVQSLWTNYNVLFDII
jgi:hypothetical protein